jgi:glycosyltransferase involved in cell wall biosynthesis
MISAVVPVHNGQETLDACLGAIFRSDVRLPLEVLVVDDGSTDSSLEVARSYPCRIFPLAESRGRSHARNLGAERARFDILVFIDADIVITRTTLSQIVDFFAEHPEVSAVDGILDDRCPYPNFFSQYKNLYMHDLGRRLPERLNFLFGSPCALRRVHFEPFSESLDLAEDTELGQRLAFKGRRIALLHSLQVTHWKRHGFRSIVRNDFQIPFTWAHLFLENRGLSQVFSHRRFAHARSGQMGSVLASPFFILCLALTPFFPVMAIPGAVFLAGYLLLNARFHLFLFKKRGAWFALRALAFTLFDQTVMLCGIAAGFGRHILSGGRPPGFSGHRARKIWRP